MKHFNHAPLPVQLSEAVTATTTPEGRCYSTPDGVFPSVTTVTGWSKRAFFAKWRRDNPQESRRVTTRGTALHSVIESYIKNEMTEAQYAERCKQPTPEWDMFCSMREHIDRIDPVVAVEVPLWSRTVGLAGRVDCIGHYDGKPSIIDFKSSSNPKSARDIENYFMQATAYALMWQDRTQQIVNHITIIMGVESTGECLLFESGTREWIEPLVDAIRLWRADQPQIASK